MLQRFRAWLRTTLKEGFWFPAFRYFVDRAYKRISLGNWFNRWLTDGERAPSGATELYQFVLILIGAGWLFMVNRPAHPIFASQIFQVPGFFAALYPITELFLFSLHWTFVATGELHSIRRSLAAFLLNLFELAIYFSIAFALAGCSKNYTAGWAAFYDNFRSIFNLELVAVRETAVCQFSAHYEIVVAATLLVIIIASLVGAVVRPEKQVKENR